MSQSNTDQSPKIGEKWNWKNQSERLVYLGLGSGGSAGWHQFALVNNPDVVWCEVLERDMHMLERTIDDACPGLDDLEDELLPDPRIRSPRKYDGSTLIRDCANTVEIERRFKNRGSLPTIREQVDSINRHAKSVDDTFKEVFKSK